jgi:glycogen synthase
MLGGETRKMRVGLNTWRKPRELVMKQMEAALDYDLGWILSINIYIYIYRSSEARVRRRQLILVN